MVKNLWNKIRIVCGNHENNFPEMTLKTGHRSMFYSCPKYYPENRNSNEYACVNNVSTEDFEKILEKLSEEINEQMIFGTTPNLLNLKFKIKNIEITVIEHTDKSITIKILNKHALATR